MAGHSKHPGFLPAAERVLELEGKPLHYREITQRALDNGWVVTSGKTPEATMNARIASQIKKGVDASKFVRVGPGLFGLRAWVDEGKLDDKSVERAKFYIAAYPIYERTRAVLPAWHGEARSEITGMRQAIYDLTGTPQEPMDWSDPDHWIPERLSGEARRLAEATWLGSGRQVNPRHVFGHWQLANHHDLLVEDSVGCVRLTEAGRDFVDHPAGTTAQTIDKEEGLVKLLALVSEIGPAARADLVEPFGEFIRSESGLQSDSAVKSALWSRLRNLDRRGLVERSGKKYEVTQSGLDYLEKSGELDRTLDQEIRRLLTEQKGRVREGIHEILSDLDPIAFEHLVKRLLGEIGYEEVEVTSPSNDKGVDVVGRIDMGITSVREVVQVKRQRSNVSRRVLDALRGVLHRFDAVRGTIITTGGFTKGTQEAAFEAGAAPITLIDGERLLDLMTDNGLGVRKKKTELWELDPDAFAGLLPGEEDESGEPSA